MDNAATQDNALRLIVLGSDRFSKTERLIADFILKNPQRFVGMTMRSISKEIGVSEGSIINFADSLGFEGFTQLKINVALNISGRDSVVFGTVAEGDTALSVLRRHKDNISVSLEETCANMTDEALNLAVSLIINAKKRVEVYGVGTSAPIAEDAYLRLMKTGIPAYGITDALVAPVSALMLDSNCLAIAISHSGRTKEIVRAMSIAKERGAKTLCITGYVSSPLASICDCTLMAASNEVHINKNSTVSRLSQLLIIDSLCAYINYAHRNSTALMNIRTEDICEEYYVI